MTEFEAYFSGEKIYLNGRKCVKVGETLTKLLSKPTGYYKEVLLFAQNYENRLHYPEDEAEAYDSESFFQEAIKFYAGVEDVIMRLAPYKYLEVVGNRLQDTLNEYAWAFHEYPKMSVLDDEDDDIDYHQHFYTRFGTDDWDEPEEMGEIFELNDKLRDFAVKMRIYLEDILRVKYAFTDFLERINSRNRFLTNEEIADTLAEFEDEKKLRMYACDYLRTSGSIQLDYKRLRIKEKTELCEHYKFTSLGAFLYIELFKGLEMHYIPRKCSYCGRWFLIEAGIYSEYCTRPVKGREDGKTCRDLGHFKKYSEKVANDPIWLTYNRAYKQHYARLLKKKMTQAEFQEWADYAIKLRDMVEHKKIGFDEYYKKIRE